MASSSSSSMASTGATPATMANCPPPASASEPVSDANLKRGSGDVGWNYDFLRNLPNVDRMQCKLCHHKFNGGVNRIKQHIAQEPGNVKACPKASREDQKICKEALVEARIKKQKKIVELTNLRDNVAITNTGSGSESEQTKQTPLNYGAFGRYVEINPIDPTKFTRQQNVTNLLDKKRIHDMQMYIARWVYESGIPFNAINRGSFIQMLEAIGQYGPGAPPPTQYQLREPYLIEAVKDIKMKLKRFEEEWAYSGCSIMTDGWSDRRRRSVMNICVHCKEGVSFFGSKDVSEHSHTGTFIEEYVDQAIESIGVNNVVQVVTDNASNNMTAAILLRTKRPSIFLDLLCHTYN